MVQLVVPGTRLPGVQPSVPGTRIRTVVITIYVTRYVTHYITTELPTFVHVTSWTTPAGTIYRRGTVTTIIVNHEARQRGA